MYVLVIISVLMLLWTVHRFRMEYVGENGLNSILKLVMSNNVDRAIKVCNAVPNASVLQGFKQLLVRANRVYYLDLATQTADLALRVQIQRDRHSANFQDLLLLVTGLTLWALLGLEVFEWLPVTLLILAFVAKRVVLIALVNSLAAGRVQLLMLRNALYQRAHYVPRHMKSVPVSECSAEVQQKWEAAMAAFEDNYTSRRGHPDLGTPEEEYEAIADPNGVLPPLGK